MRHTARDMGDSIFNNDASAFKFENDNLDVTFPVMMLTTPGILPDPYVREIRCQVNFKSVAWRPECELHDAEWETEGGHVVAFYMVGEGVNRTELPVMLGDAYLCESCIYAALAFIRDQRPEA